MLTSWGKFREGQGINTLYREGLVCWDVGIHIPHNTVFFLYLATICCPILNSLNIKHFPHIHAFVVQKSRLFYLVSHSSLFLIFFPFDLFLPVFSAFCQHYSDASWIMINTIMSLIFSRIKIHIACSRENCFVNPLFILGNIFKMPGLENI